jgi:hypothetical protein
MARKHFAGLILVLGTAFFLSRVSAPMEQYQYPSILVKGIKGDIGSQTEIPNELGSNMRTANTESFPEEEVLVETNQREYQPNEEVIITVTNNLGTKITTFDQQAFCTILRLEQRIGEEWKEVRNCFSRAPARLVTLELHSKTTLKFKRLSPGIYRSGIIFSPGESFNFGKSYVSFSPPFTVL